MFSGLCKSITLYRIGENLKVILIIAIVLFFYVKTKNINKHLSKLIN